MQYSVSQKVATMTFCDIFTHS